MSIAEFIWWLCAAVVLWAYAGYPLSVAAAARWRGRDIRLGPFDGSVSIILAAHNEGARIARRISELCGLIASSHLDGELIVVCDGCTDATTLAARTRAGDDPRVRVIELPEKSGKSAALNAGFAAARGEILIFADARQTWADNALPMLLRNFTDPTVGAVGGELVLQSTDGVLAGVGLYWRFEKWLRRQESRLHSTVGVSGAIAAVRRDRFVRIPSGTVLDDVYWPLRVVMQGSRVIHEPAAKAFDRLPDRPRDEFRRKVRTLSSNFQLLHRLPGALWPARNPIWWQFISHKVMRLAVPWALLGMLALSAALDGAGYRAALWGQLAFYALAVAGIGTRAGGKVRAAAAAGAFVALNAAALVGFFVWATGGAGRAWTKANYQTTTAKGLS